MKGLRVDLVAGAMSLALLLAGCQTTGGVAGAGRPAETIERAARFCIDSATLNVGSPAEVLARCDRAIAAGGETGRVLADLHSARAAARAAQFDLAGALADREKAVGLDPASGYRQRELGWSLSDLNRHAEALDAFDAALAREGADKNALAGRALSLRSLERFDEALQAVETGRALHPGEVFFLRETAWIHYSAGRLTEARDWFRKTVQADGEDAWAYYGLGWLLDDLERYDEALAHYDRAIEIDASAPSFHALRGNTLNNLGRHREALAAADRALAIHAGDGYAHRVRGWALTGMGDLEKAAGAFAAAAAIAPEDDQAHFGLAWVLSDLNRNTRALEAARRAVDLDGQNPHNWHLLGYLQLNSGDPGEAIESFRAVLRLDPDYATARYNLATANAMLGRGEAALEALAEALELGPNPEFASDVVSAMLAAGLKDAAARAAKMITGPSDPRAATRA